jgi:regulator of sigma E protease
MIGFALTAVLYVVPFVLILTIVVTIHELGHFLAGKTFGVAIDRFAIGFGKALWSRTDRSGVEWRLGWIPLGGYVKFTGDSNDASVPDAEDLEGLRKQIEEQLGPEAVKTFYHFKPIWQRAVIAAAGPIANFVLAVVAFTALLLIAGEQIAPAKVESVVPGTVAAQAGFQAGDTIQRINGHRIHDFGDVIGAVTMRAGEPMVFQVLRNSNILDLNVTPKRVAMKDEVTGFTTTIGQIGLVAQASYHKTYGPVEAVGRSFGMMEDRLESTFTYLRRIVTGRESGDQLSGVVGMTYMTGKVITNAVHTEPSLQLQLAQAGVDMLLLLGMISVGIGFVNLLPIPVLDGGHLLFYGYEAIARRPAGPRLQAASYRVGLALVLCLMLFATWNDLQRLQTFKFLGGLFS